MRGSTLSSSVHVLAYSCCGCPTCFREEGQQLAVTVTQDRARNVAHVDGDAAIPAQRQCQAKVCGGGHAEPHIPRVEVATTILLADGKADGVRHVHVAGSRR